MSVVGVVSEWWVVSRWEMNDKVRHHQQSDLLQGWLNETGSWTKYFLRYFEGRASGLYGRHRQRKLICSDLWKTTRLNTENSSRKWKCNNRLTLATGIVIICFITSAMEVLFSLAFVFCLFVCLFVLLRKNLLNRFSQISVERSTRATEETIAGCPLVMESHGISEDHFPGLESHGK